MSVRNSITTAVLLGALVGCGSDSDDSKSSYLQAAHSSVDAPTANIWVNGESTLTDVDYGLASGYLTVPAGNNSVEVQVNLPGETTATVIPSTTLSLDENSKYTVFVVGEADASAANPVEALVIDRPKNGDASSSSFDIQVVHASSGVPDVDLYVTAPGADVSTAAAVDTLSFKDDTGVINLPADTYQVRLTLAGTSTVAFDSGPIDLAANTELTVAAIPNENSIQSSPVKLLVMDGTTSSIIYNITEKSSVEVGHLVSDAPVVDIALNGTEAISDVAFKGLTGYSPLDAGSYDIAVYPDNTPGSPVIDAKGVAFEKGLDYGVYAVGKLTPTSTIEPLVINTDRRPVATSAKLNIIHAAPSAQVVDVYLTETSDITNSSPALSEFEFKKDAQEILVAAGSYFVTVTGVGSKTAAIGPLAVTVENAKVYQAIAIDDAPSGFTVLLSDITD